jgi:hypothetical protein
MRTWARYREYLTAIRAEVCTRCPERTSDEFPFGPACWQCGVEVELPELVDSINDAEENPADLDSDSDRPRLCAQCAHRADPRCPCPVRALSPLLVRTVKAVDARRVHRALFKRLLRRQPRRERVPIREMVQAYEEATGMCVCAD